MNIYFNKILGTLFLLNILLGCGFHLAGSGEFASSLDNTSVQSAVSSRELVRLIERNLKSNKINIVEVDQATALINILFEESEKTVLTLDSDGKAREYELILNVIFDVKKPDNSYLLREQSIRLNRDFVFDKSSLLGANEEEQQLFSEMRSDAARIIVSRLQTIED